MGMEGGLSGGFWRRGAVSVMMWSGADPGEDAQRGRAQHRESKGSSRGGGKGLERAGLGSTTWCSVTSLQSSHVSACGGSKSPSTLRSPVGPQHLSVWQHRPGQWPPLTSSPPVIPGPRHGLGTAWPCPLLGVDTAEQACPAVGRGAWM